MAWVTVGDGRVRIKLSLLERLLTLHGSLDIPLEHVVSVSVDPVAHAWWRGRRVGVSVPGASHGTFISDGGLSFYDYRNGDRCLTLELRDQRYRRVIVEVDRPQEPSMVKAAIDAALAPG